MAGRRSVTALIALDAVVIDTETTGLDPRKGKWRGRGPQLMPVLVLL